MGGIRRAIVTGGLVVLTGPLSLALAAQEYVDVEAERAAEAAQSEGAQAADPYDPYRVQPAQAYPSTSYGVSTGSPPGGTAAASAGGADQNIGNLVFQLQQLQQEVMMLNGKLEEQAYELRRLKEQYQERYVDMDRRIVALGGGAASVAPAAPAAGSRPGASQAQTAPAAVDTPPRSPRPQAAEQPGEGEAYRAAYALVRGQQWNAAIDAFKAFLRDYPDGRYAPNAHYWLGELYLVVQPPQLESARQSFMLLLTQYPDNNKVPDALYKLGKVHYQKGNREKGREFLQRVISEYGSSNSSAVQLARDFLDENY